jgi:hypothetical protein
LAPRYVDVDAGVNAALETDLVQCQTIRTQSHEVSPVSSATCCLLLGNSIDTDDTDCLDEATDCLADDTDCLDDATECLDDATECLDDITDVALVVSA